MKILINGRFLCRQATGVDRYATEILRVFDRWHAESALQAQGIECEIAVPSDRLMHWRPEAIPLNTLAPGSGHVWEQWALGLRRDYDVLVSLCNTGPVLARRHVVAVHDATPMRVPESFSRSFRTLYRLMMPALGRTAARIVTVSEFSRGEIADCYRIEPSKIGVIGNSAEHVLRTPTDDSIIDRLNLRDRTYVLAVATNARHKNVSILAEVARRLGEDDVQMVLAGGANSRVFDHFADSGDDGVIRAGYVSDGELRALYEHAGCFVFPSLYEGFGIPPLEAMELGCPVVSSSAAALPEVLGDAALYVSPDDPQGFCTAIRRTAQDAELRQGMIAKGLARAAEYSWEASAKSLLAICHEISSEDLH